MKIRLALDWTPNTNHTGFFVAKEKGYYQDQGLEVSLISVAEDNYQITPAKKVELGQAELALCPTESLLSYQTKSKPFDLRALGAVFQTDLSAIVTRKSSGISRPAQLDGGTYASYQARYEDQIVKEMIINDGGKGNLRLIYPDKLKIWPEFLNGLSDATWIFNNWEGSLASKSGEVLNAFKLSDFEIPYSYSPVIAGSASLINQEKTSFHKFMEATKMGFEYCQYQPEKAAQILAPYVPTYDAHIDLLASQKIANAHYGLMEWGTIEEDKMQIFLEWLRARGLDQTDKKASQLIAQLS